MTNYNEITDALFNGEELSKEDYIGLIENGNPRYIAEKAVEKRRQYYGDEIYIRGLIEFTNFCKNDCLYCGIRRSNKKAERYRLTKAEILDCCENGRALGFRTFVLQGGEDAAFSDDEIADIVYSVKSKFSDCALTLSVGEKSRRTYKLWFDAGADRYLLRLETANKEHYSLLHPKEMSFDNRLRCLYDLKEIGYQTGCGFMVGSPWQTTEMLADELLFLRDFKPHMVGIGPFIPHKDTPFARKLGGDANLTCLMLALTRLTAPKTLLPSTTALSTISPQGRKQGFLFGANVCMPNLSPNYAKQKYALYNGKKYWGEESAEGLERLKEEAREVGCRIVEDIGNYRG